MYVNTREIELRPIITKQDADFRRLATTMEQQLFTAKVKNDLGRYEEAYTIAQTALHEYKINVSDRDSFWMTEAHSKVHIQFIKAQHASSDYLANYKREQMSQKVTLPNP